jgi:fluoride exporter
MPADQDAPTVHSRTDARRRGSRSDARPTAHRARVQPDVLAVIAAGGVIGAEARYGVGLLLPHAADAFPWSTLLVNALGCLLIGALMVVLAETTAPHRLARPFLGVGVLGGFTTFSTYAVDVRLLLLANRPVPALAYLVGTLAAALVAVWVGATATRGLLRRGRPVHLSPERS